MGSLFGPALGAFALVLLQELFSDLTKHWLLPMGAFVVAAVLLLPEGLSGLLQRVGTIFAVPPRLRFLKRGS
jgi:branched-chain amino acid transport system permease protein